MRPAPNPPISHQRLSRLALWAGLWLARLAALLLGDGREAPAIERFTQRFARIVRGLIFLRVALAMPRLRRMRRPWPLRRLVSERRAVFGSRIRRALRARTLAERIAKLRDVLSHLDTICARLLRRLRHGLSRRRPRQWRGVHLLTFAAPMLAPACADTS